MIPHYEDELYSNRRYNIYYTDERGVAGVLMRVSYESVFTNLRACLSLNDEITGIIDADKDN